MSKGAPWITALRVGMPPLRGLLPLFGLLTLWQIIDPHGSPYFPPPSAWWMGLAGLAKNGRLLTALSATLTTFTLAIALACVIGGLLGLLMGRSRPARRARGPLLDDCRGRPPPVIVPVTVLFRGYL